ncbi:DUF3967 domain-containing protein [Halalkalibacter hemicellulosilyticus]|uniref:DUF3967 domain-containing protein n=1 Tax=Halalkalibacter hemicellulosilyticusJCM 9152 TaxID=1236971 RepID=W4QMJ2_9BACI|nr:DUF3967 domain-containing protein [Halalkalibacter hemicellulosilyticus]GAE32863.1 hypothetical protein JCM9152_4452 [Halalkalibacter hemicellulosilyticusJCM 9152]
MTKEKVYTPKQIADELGIGSSTLRKWCLSLEQTGYSFMRSSKDQRLFTSTDLKYLHQFNVLIKEHHFTLKNASMVIYTGFQQQASKSQAPSVLHQEEQKQPFYDEQKEIIQKMSEQLEKQEHFNRALLERLDQRDQKLEERMNERDQNLMKALREIQETKKLIAASQEKKTFLDRLKFWR